MNSFTVKLESIADHIVAAIMYRRLGLSMVSVAWLPAIVTLRPIRR